MKKILTTIVLLFITLNSIAQTNNLFKYVMDVDSLFKAKKYTEILYLFELGKKDQTREFHIRMNDYYYIACCYAKIGDNNNSFNNLNKLLKKYDYSDTTIFRDKDLDNIKNDDRWSTFKSGVLKNQRLIEAKKVKYAKLIGILDSLKIIDQRQAAFLNLENLKKYNQHGIDSINMFVYKCAQDRSEEVQRLLKHTPWLNPSLLGVDAFDMIFLSAQHSGDIKKMKKLLIRYKKNRRTPMEYAHYAMLYDRIKTKTKNYQRYGTQLIINTTTEKKFYFKIEDFKRLNEYRKYCYFDTIQEDMIFHNMPTFQESTRLEQDKIKH